MDKYNKRNRKLNKKLPKVINTVTSKRLRYG